MSVKSGEQFVIDLGPTVPEKVVAGVRRVGPLAADADVTAARDVALHASMVTPSGYDVADDFIGGASDGAVCFGLGWHHWTGGNYSDPGSPPTSDDTRDGIATAYGFDGWEAYQHSRGGVTLNASRSTSCEWVVCLPSVTEEFDTWFGWSSGELDSGAYLGSEALVVLFDSATSDKWILRSANKGTIVDRPTELVATAGQWVRFRIDVPAGTGPATLTASIEGGPESVVAALERPIVTISRVGAVFLCRKATGGSAAILQVDYCRLRSRRLLPR